MKRADLALAAVLTLAVLSPSAPAAMPAAIGDTPIPSLSPIVKKVSPAVVNIATRGTIRDKGPQNPLLDDPFFRRFFDVPPDNGGGAHDRPFQSAGSGVIFDAKQGYIVTNAHVVENATEITVTLQDGRDLKAEVVGSDEPSDVAVLKVKPEGATLVQISLGDSSKVEQGDFVLAIGNPFGLQHTVTSGIISGLSRTGINPDSYENFIQTDASINPGNSGGALVNLRGELIGINTAILSHGSGGNEGIGFAVPVNLARRVMDDILDDGHVTRAYLGIVPQNVTPAIAKAMGTKEDEGVLVGDVSADGPAHASGIQRGDIILKVNDKTINDSNELRNSISMMKPETSVKLTILRDGSSREMSVKLGELPNQEAKAKSETGSSQSALEGVNVEDINAQTAKQLGLPSSASGVVVTDIDPSSPEAASGLRKGDVIQEVNHHAVKNVSDFEEAVHKAGNNPLLLVNRQGTTIFIAA